MESSRPRVRRKSSTFTLSRASTAASWAASAAAHPTPPVDDTSTFDWVGPPPGSSSTPIMTSTLSSTSLSSTAHSINSGGSVGPSVGSVPNVPGTSLGSTLDGLRTLVAKRITAWTYLKNAGEGRVYWFNTILLTTEDLKSTFPNDKMRNRTTRFAVLGMSLSSLLDIAPAHDFLRGLLSLAQEFEAVPEDRYGGRNQQKSLFKVGSRSRRAGGAGSAANGGADFPMGLPQEGGEASFLFTPNIPFDLDYFHVLVTTCELLIETYTKIATYLGPAGAGAGSSAAAGSFPSPPGVGAQQHRGSVTSPVSAGGGAGGAGATGSAGLSQALADVVYKVDARLKKLVALLSKEIDTLARQTIKHELDSLGGGGLLDLLE